MRNKRTIQISVSAMFIALVVVATFINVPFPGAAGGLVHLGTLMSLIIFKERCTCFLEQERMNFNPQSIKSISKRGFI